MTKKLKVAQVMDSFYPNIDGPTNVVRNYAMHINEAEECQVLVPAAKPSLHYVDEQPFEVKRCRSYPATKYGYRCGTPRMDRKFNKRVASEKFDIYHAHSPFIMARYALYRGKKDKVPVVLTMHTKFKDDFARIFRGPLKPIGAIAMRYIMKSFRRADVVWTVNDASVGVLREYGYTGAVDVVRNGTDLRYPEGAEQLIRDVNERHGLFGQKNVFIFVGRLVMYKNLELTVRALKLLADRGEDFRMLVVGKGPDEGKLRAIIEACGLSDRFIFTGPIHDRRTLQGYYLRADLFLFPSTYDTSSLVPVEAACHKLPTLLIRGCCTAERIEDGVNGFLCEENAESYADRVQAIIADPALAARAGEEAERTIYRTWDKVAEEVMEKYRAIIESYNK